MLFERSFFSKLAVLSSTLISTAISIAPSDTWRDADIGQSSYVGGNHNMDPSIVDSPQFGQLWKIPFNNKERFYAKPLVYTPDSTGTQILFLASSQNYIRTVNAKTGAVLNTRQVATPFLQSDIGCTDIPDNIGITGTPTIDPSTDIAYFYAKSYIPNYRVAGNTGTFNGVYYFYAVDVKTLEDVPGFPILVDGSAAENDPRKVFVGGTILQRPSLLQVGNVVYAGFGGHCDLFNYTGTVLGVDITSKTIVTNWVVEAGPQAPFNTDWTKNGGGGGIWQSGLGLASDGPRIFFVTGNGQGHENQGLPATGQSGCRTLGESAINLNIGTGGKLQDYQNMDGGDQDFGSGGISLLDPTVFKGTGVNRMALTSGKNGKIYVLNADNLGGYKQGPGQTDLVLQTITTTHAVFGGTGSYPLEGGFFYVTPVGQPTYAYKLGFDSAGKPLFTLAGQSAESSAGRVGVGIPTVTTNKGKAGTGIVWMTDPDAGLRAWYAVPGPDGFLKTIKLPQVNGLNKFQRPVFGDTRLYVSDSNGILYCLGSPVNLPLNCSSVDFGNVPLGSSKSAVVNCTALIKLTSVDGLTVGDARFEVDNSTLPTGNVAAGTTFSFPVRWNLTSENAQNAPNASYGNVSPGIKTTALTVYTTNSIPGFSSAFPISLSGNEVSEEAYLTLTPLTVDFGGLVLGVSGENPSTTQSFTIANLGLQPLEILGYGYTQDDVSDANITYTNATKGPDGVWDIGSGFTATGLPEVLSYLQPGDAVTVQSTFKAINGTGEYLAYFNAWTTGGHALTILEGSASTAPIANFSVSTSEGGWIDSLTIDFGNAAPGESIQRQIRICNEGGSVLSISKSKPPLGVIRALVPGIDLHESQNIPVNQCAYGTVVFNPTAGAPPNQPDRIVTNVWTLNTDDLNFGVHEVQLLGTIHDRVVGPTYTNGSARYQYLGCYTESTPRLLPQSGYPAGLQENGRCQTACLAGGFTFAGTEYKQECWCGNVPPPGSKFHNESDLLCSFSCTNDTTQACGGNGGYISIYYDTTKFTPTNSTFDPNDQASGPVIVNSTGNYNYIGCYSEATGGKALTGKTVAAQKGVGGSVEYCAAGCQGYKYFGVEFSNECYCGNTLGAGSALIVGNSPADTGCSMLCGGNQTEYCGGRSKMNLYQLNATSSSSSSVTAAASSSSIPVSATLSLNASTTASTSSSSTFSSSTPTGPIVVPSVGSFASIGCYNELKTGRALNLASFANNSLTVELCGAFCTKYQYFGVEYGRECYCGNSIPAGSAPAISGCTKVCAGNSLEYCGGSSRLIMYNKTLSTNSSIVVSTSSSSSVSSSPSSESSTGSNSPLSTTFSSASISTSLSVSSNSSSSSPTPASSTSTLNSSSSTTTLLSSSLESSTTATASPTPLSCPSANATIYQAPSGANFTIECYIDHSGGGMPGSLVYTKTLDGCIAACDAAVGCVDVSWLVHGGGACYLKNKVGAIVTGKTGVYGAKLLTSTSTSSTVTPTPTVAKRYPKIFAI